MKSQNESNNEITSIYAAELFEKAWCLMFGNSNLKIEQSDELETRWIQIGDLFIFGKILKSAYDSKKIRSKYLRIQDVKLHIDLDISDNEIRENRKFTLQKNNIMYRVFEIFTKNKESLKKIKFLQKKLIREINLYHDSLKDNLVL